MGESRQSSHVIAWGELSLLPGTKQMPSRGPPGPPSSVSRSPCSSQDAASPVLPSIGRPLRFSGSLLFFYENIDDIYLALPRVSPLILTVAPWYALPLAPFSR